MKKTIALLLITLVTIQTTKAQENGQDKFGSWMMFFGMTDDDDARRASLTGRRDLKMNS